MQDPNTRLSDTKSGFRLSIRENLYIRLQSIYEFIELTDRCGCFLNSKMSIKISFPDQDQDAPIGFVLIPDHELLMV